MKREILFRGKHKNRMVFGHYFYDPFLDKHFIRTLAGAGVILEDLEVDLSTVGQYTGLQDKNGVKIFEGDYTDSDSYGRLEVKWNRMKCEFYAENVHDKELYFISSDDEVTGNIHED